MATIDDLKDAVREHELHLAATMRDRDEGNATMDDIKQCTRSLSEAREQLNRASGIESKAPSAAVLPADKIRNIITELRRRLDDAMENGAEQSIVDKLTRLIAVKRNELEKLKKPNNEEKILELQRSLQVVIEERTKANVLFDAREARIQDELRSLGVTDEVRRTLPDDDEDNERLRHGISDRRLEFKKRWGVDPGAGVDGTATGLVRVRAPPRD